MAGGGDDAIWDEGCGDVVARLGTVACRNQPGWLSMLPQFGMATETGETDAPPARARTQSRAGCFC